MGLIVQTMGQLSCPLREVNTTQRKTNCQYPVEKDGRNQDQDTKSCGCSKTRRRTSPKGIGHGSSPDRVWIKPRWSGEGISPSKDLQLGGGPQYRIKQLQVGSGCRRRERQ